MMRHRSRIQWLAEGDSNTQFFQRKTSGRRAKNNISKLERGDGSVSSDPGELADMATAFYSNLYTSEGTICMEEVLSHIPWKVGANLNARLNAEYTKEEVKEALFQMFPTKAPGPDGFPAHFFQRHWELCGDEVTDMVLRVLKGEDSPEEINKTFIVLIPKIASPKNLGQFRPISLCNVIFKIASKVLANRLKLILPEIISEEQSAFVPGRLITDNFISAYECLHYMKTRKVKGNRFCALKLDMMKAYDRIEWNYLERVMLKLGISARFTEIIMRCVTSVSFSVVFNGAKQDDFSPSRGLRQGDPISPYLFLLCVEGLSSLLKNSGPRYLAKGIRIGIHAPWVSHLLFADDCIIFSEASKKGADRIQTMIENYNRASGQLVNKQKSSVFFSPNTEHDVKMEVRNSLGIQNEALGAKYLGLPTAVGRSTKEAFEHIPEHVRSLVSGWCEKKLNAAGRDVLLKSVAQAMPIYSMNCFKLSSVTCKKITSSISSYYWGGCPEKRKMHWLNWPNMTRSKLHGGMGFRDIPTFNLAMLGKQGWRLMMKPQSLFARVLKGKYYPHCDFMQANKGKHSSHTWRAIISGRTVLNMGLIKRVGTGTEINIWEDKWIPSNPSLRPLWKPNNTHLTLVCDLIREDGTWDDHLIRNSFLTPDADASLFIPLCGVDCDTLAWAF